MKSRFIDREGLSESRPPARDGESADAKIPPTHPRYRIHAAETIGLLLISALLLVITLIRYWHHINWSAR